jgi:hypothetical protein
MAVGSFGVGWGGRSSTSVRSFCITMYSRIFIENLNIPQQTVWQFGVCRRFRSLFREMSGQPIKLGPKRVSHLSISFFSSHLTIWSYIVWSELHYSSFSSLGCTSCFRRWPSDQYSSTYSVPSVIRSRQSEHPDNPGSVGPPVAAVICLLSGSLGENQRRSELRDWWRGWSKKNQPFV